MVRKTARKTSARSPKKIKKQPARETVFAPRGLSGFSGYDFILLVDRITGQAERVGGKKVPPEGLYEKNRLHIAALEETAKHGVSHYEWSLPVDGKNVLYQTTCFSLPNLDGHVRNIISFSRNITGKSVPYFDSRALHEGTRARTFAQMLLATRETEKKEISKTLHDEIGSSAVMLTALLSLVRASVTSGNQSQALRDLSQLDEQLKATIERLKNVIVSLRPLSLENKGGLGGAVRDLLENISQFSMIPYRFDYDAVDEQICLSDNVKILLYRIVQEALTNIVKHARAKRIRVSLKQAAHQIRLEVCDDGIGFEPAQQLSIEHVGLLAMRDSVELLGGTISIKSAPGKGTRIEVSCPCIVYGGNLNEKDSTGR